MMLGQADLDALNVSINMSFNRGLTDAAPMYPQFAMELPSSTKTEHYPLTNMLKGMTEWQGNLQLGNLELKDWTITNKHYANALAVDLDDVEDDMTGAYGQIAMMLGMSTAVHPDTMLAELMYNGLAEVGYDGEYFFDSDHPIPGSTGTQSNLVAGALSATTFEEARQKLFKLKFGGGDGVYPNRTSMKLLLVTTPTQMSTAEGILEAAFGTNGVSNTSYQKASVAILPQLENHSTTFWALLNVGLPIRSFILQRRKAAQLVTQDTPSSDSVFERNEVRYRVDYRGAVGYGLYHFAVGGAGA